MPEQTRQQSRVFRERDHAVTDIAGRQHLQLITETSGTPTVVRHRHDRGKTLDPDFFVGLADQSLEAGEECGKACAAANGYQFFTACKFCLLQMNPRERVWNT